MSATVSSLLEDRIRRGEISADAAQADLGRRLDALGRALSVGLQGRRGFLSRTRAAKPRGLYIHGGVGRGKTMLMDLFFETVRSEPRRRIHFHEFMAEVHDRIKRGRATTDGDPIPFVAAEIAGEAPLLCLDELQVTDIADAMILGRLFKGLFDRETVVVATSNCEPAGLYPNGLNRQLFLPFVDMIAERMDVVELASACDFRLTKLAGRRLYFTPVNDASQCELDAHFERLTGHHPPQPMSIAVKGRQVRVPLASMGVARFSFADLCESPLGALDYLHLTHAFHTILIDGIPRLGPEKRNEARRLVALVDTLYDNRVCLIASAECEPHELYATGDGAVLFERTASRLIEMRSEAYLTKGGERPGAAFKALPL